MSDEYARGHVPGAGWICRSRLESRLPSAAPDRVRPLVLTCGDGVASTLAAATVRSLGYKDVSVLDGGTARVGGRRTSAGKGRHAPVGRARRRRAQALPAGPRGDEAYLKWEEALDPDGTSPHRLLRDAP